VHVAWSLTHSHARAHTHTHTHTHTHIYRRELKREKPEDYILMCAGACKITAPIGMKRI